MPGRRLLGAGGGYNAAMPFTLPWGREHRRREILAQPFPLAWRLYLEAYVPHCHSLSPAERARLQDDTRLFIAEKEWEAPEGLILIDEMKVAVAAQACLMLLGFSDDRPERRGLFPNVTSIILYPDTFRVRRKEQRGYVESETQAHLLGEAWSGDWPVVLSWGSIAEDRDFRAGFTEGGDDGHNVVLHEFAHKLDMIDGGADGVPRLSKREDYEAWAAVMSRAFIRLRRDAAWGRVTLLNDYGAESEAEFFAVATEAFFEAPLLFRSEMPDLYAALRGYYGQDTAARLEETENPNAQDANAG